MASYCPSRDTTNTDVAVSIDFGISFSSISVCKGGVNTVIPDEYGNERVPSVVAFVSDGGVVKRLVGREVIENDNINPKHIVRDVKRLMGRRFDDDYVRKSMDMYGWSFHVTANSEGNAQVSIKLDGHDRLDVSPEEISALIFAKLKKMAEDHLNMEINKNVVITIPMYFDGAQRRAMKKAAELANLGDIVMMPEANAVVMAHLVRSGICPL